MKSNLTRLHLSSRQSLLYLAVCLIVVPTFGQVKDARKFSAVPARIRERLIERLNLFIEYDRANQYEKKYDLFSEAYITVSWKNKTDYVKFIQGEETKGARERLIAFNVSSVEDFSVDDSDYRIFHIKGVVKFQRGNKVKKKVRLINARFDKGEWYFSDWLEETMIVD